MTTSHKASFKMLHQVEPKIKRNKPYQWNDHMVEDINEMRRKCNKFVNAKSLDDKLDYNS